MQIHPRYQAPSWSSIEQHGTIEEQVLANQNSGSYNDFGIGTSQNPGGSILQKRTYVSVQDSATAEHETHGLILAEKMKQLFFSDTVLPVVDKKGTTDLSTTKKM